MKWVTEFLVGVTTSLGFSLLEGSLNVFSGLQAFWCWMMTHFLDYLQEGLIQLIEIFPGGGFIALADITRVVVAWNGLNGIFPLYKLGAIFLIWLTFQLFWIPIRTVLKLIPGVA